MTGKIAKAAPRAGIGVLAAALLLSVPANVTAEPNDLLERAIQRFGAGQFAASIEALKRAKGRTKTRKRLGRIMLYTGLNHALLEQPAAARVALVEALSHDPDLALSTGEFKPSLVALLKTVRGELGLVLVRSDARAARVWIDRTYLGEAPVYTHLLPGVHKVLVRRGSRVFRRQLRLAAGATLQITARLADPVGPRAQLVPAALEDVAPRPTFWGRRRVWTWVAAGSAAIAGGVAIGLGVSAGNLHDDFELLREAYLADPSPTARADVEQLGDQVDRRAAAANVVVGVAGALGVAAVVLLLLEGRSDETARRALRLGPQVGGVSGVTFGGRF